MASTVKEDDFVEYYLFPSINDTENEESQLNNYILKIKNIVDKYSSGYLWHRDKFNIILRSSNNVLSNEEYQSKEDSLPHMYGVLHYGDNIEDEWFTVFLLLQISREINDLIIRVVDSDGEFLLIEAANFLPAWANPESCEGRVYLYKGKIHLVPLNQPNLEDEMTVPEAINFILKEPLITEASTNIQKAILNRISNYPDKINELLHRAKVYLPIGVATILHYKPELISAAVLAFCNRDLIDMKACRAMKYFPPENRVYSSVLFTKCLYAMLVHSKHIPDRKIGWNLPDFNNHLYKSHSLGVKIACGFEILASLSKNNEMESEKSWRQYLHSLNEKKYFKQYLEGSQEYNNLLNKAKDYYKTQKVFSVNNNDIGHEILDLNRKLDHNIDEFKSNETSLPKDDDDSWLELNSQELDKMLAEKYGQNNFIRVNSHTDASDFSGKLTEFLENVSSLDGAEFPDKNFDNSPKRPQRGIKKKDKTKLDTNATNPSNSTDTKVSFDPNNFSCAVQNILDLVIPDDSWDLESGSEMSEYGDESENELDRMDSKKIKQYMEEMDKELAGTTIGKSFETKSGENDNFDDIESFKPVDIDMTALKNILQSYQSQMGAAGPASNMLGPMGVHLEPSSSQNDNC